MSIFSYYLLFKVVNKQLTFIGSIVYNDKVKIVKEEMV